MNFVFFVLFSMASSALAAVFGKILSPQQKFGQEWTEALNDFKNLVHVVTFGEVMPSHHSNPLQMLIQKVNFESSKNPFELHDNWSGIKINKNSPSQQRGPNIFLSMKKMSHLKKSKDHHKLKNNERNKNEFRERQSIDDLALLDFLVKLEEPDHRAKVAAPQNNKHLGALLMAEDRYNEIKKKIRHSQKMRNEKFELKSEKFKTKPEAQKAFKKKENNWYERLDAKSARNKITLSVAFAIIVTALFCVVVQLFKLFSKPSRAGTFEQINRRSTHGYDRIALDVEEDEENTLLN